LFEIDFPNFGCHSSQRSAQSPSAYAFIKSIALVFELSYQRLNVGVSLPFLPTHLLIFAITLPVVHLALSPPQNHVGQRR
jgi:putative Mn2+ efflux pump MntP